MKSSISATAILKEREREKYVLATNVSTHRLVLGRERVDSNLDVRCCSQAVS